MSTDMFQGMRGLVMLVSRKILSTYLIYGPFALFFVVFFIYLLTLFNIDYKTLAAYALIKIDSPPSFHKKHNKNVNKSA